jgi:hypothetical protein
LGYKQPISKEVFQKKFCNQGFGKKRKICKERRSFLEKEKKGEMSRKVICLKGIHDNREGNEEGESLLTDKSFFQEVPMLS